MRVLLVQNHEIVGPDLVEESLRRREVQYAITRVFSPRGEQASGPSPLPGTGAFDAVIVFGSPASCRNLAKTPELLAVRDLIAECVARDKAVLGFCFGSQLLAHVLGAEVRWNEAGEFGCYQVDLTEEGARSPMFDGFPPSFQAVQFHHETFGIPPGATHLATSDRCRNQAFASGRRVGLQFHLEASPRTLGGFVQAFPAAPAEVGRDPEQMLAECRASAKAQAQLCDLFVGNFLGMVEG